MNAEPAAELLLVAELRSEATFRVKFSALGQAEADWGYYGYRSSPTTTTSSLLLLQPRLLQRQRRRNRGAPFSTPVKVLQRHECSVDACKLRRHRIVDWERYLNSRIIHSMARSHVRKEMLYARIKVGQCHFLMGFLKVLRLPD
jgi:hypothetical protein